MAHLTCLLELKHPTLDLTHYLPQEHESEAGSRVWSPKSLPRFGNLWGELLLHMKIRENVRGRKERKMGLVCLKEEEGATLEFGKEEGRR